MIDQVIRHKNKSYSVWQYLLRLSLVTAVICVLLFLGDNSNQLSSFITASIVFLLSTIFAVLILLKGTKWITFFVIAYIIKVVIGLAHYLLFIDSTYFNGNGEYKSLTTEFEAVFYTISKFADLKLQHGMFYIDNASVQATHVEILNFISIPFMFFGNFIMSISPINTFFSLLISINMLLIAKYNYNFSDKKLKYIAFITAYFPITLISSLLWRDVIGISLMSIGVTMLCFTKKQSLSKYLILFIAFGLFYLHRTLYPVLLVLAFTIDTFFFSQSKKNTMLLLYKFLTIIVVILSVPAIFSLSNTASNLRMASGILNFNPLLLPIKIILGLIGPFPWTNFMLYKTIPANAYQLQDFLQGAFNISFIIVMFKFNFFSKKNINLLNLIGFLLIISGLMNSFMHMPYVAFGFIFLTPWLFTTINMLKFKRIYRYVFFSLVLLNFVMVVFFGNLGISSLWK